MRRTVLAGKGALRRAKTGRALAGSARFRAVADATGGSGGNTIEHDFGQRTGRPKRPMNAATFTQILDNYRRPRPLDDAAQRIHDQGLVSVLRDLHDDLEHAVSDAYGWPASLTTEDILFRPVELNAARVAEERSGFVRWLRPEFQNVAATQSTLGVEMTEEEAAPSTAGRQPWPATLPGRVRLVRDFLVQSPNAVEPHAVARNFLRARSPEITAILDTLVALGQIRKSENTYSL